MRRAGLGWILLALALAATSGCETVQRKFVRKHKQEKPPTPVVHFKVYAPTTSAEELYRHHLLLWHFWNSELVGGFGVSQKKIQHASQETLAELVELQRFLPPEPAQRLQALIDEHRRLDRIIQRGGLNDAQQQMLKRRFEYQERAVYRHGSPQALKDRLRLPSQEAPMPTMTSGAGGGDGLPDRPSR